MNQSSTSHNWIVDITDHSVVLVKGIDAVKFLQGQVTCDIQQLLSSADQRPSTLGAHCTHKGRMLFTFRAFCLDDNTIALVLYRELIPQLMDSLGKYIVFSKAELIDGQQDYQLLGIQGDILKQYLPHLSDTVNQVSLSDSIAAICLGEQRYELLLDKTKFADENAHFKNILYTAWQTADLNAWTLENIRSGIGEVRPETVEEFIPQMLNLQSVGDGISFDKGCYTGQEIVARMKYLGKLKRHMYRLQLAADTLPNPGDPIYSLSSEKPVGTVVMAAHADDAIEVLAVVVNTVLEEEKAYIDKEHQYQLEPLSLPYVVD